MLRLSLVSQAGNSECVQLMIDRGARMEAHDCHFGTPLHVACAQQQLDCAKVLLNAGNDPVFSPPFVCEHGPPRLAVRPAGQTVCPFVFHPKRGERERRQAP